MKTLKKSIVLALFMTVAPSIILSKIPQDSRQQKSLSFNIQAPVNILQEPSTQSALSALVNKIVKKSLG